MNFLIADTFTASFSRLSGQDQKAVKASVFDLQMDPTGNGLQLHRIDKSKDPNFWSARVNRDVRLIVHKTGESMLVAYVDHHNNAYAWAERRRIEAHPRTGAVQIVEVRERVEEVAPPETFDFVVSEAAAATTPQPQLFASLDDDALLSIGVPLDWLADVRSATEEGFFALAEHLPGEASEALLEYAAAGALPVPTPAPATANPFAHPDALRRIRPIADQDELEQALAFPWEKWGVFLHPSQRDLTDRSFAGPARVAGSAGTGKTIVAIHRAVRLARANLEARILLASFSQPLADAMAKKLLVLAPETGGIVPRITTVSFRGIAEQMYQLEHGVRPRIASDSMLRERLREMGKSLQLKGFSDRFLLSEWTNVIDAWGIATFDDYATVQRMGRKSRLGPNQRERLWPVFNGVRSAVEGGDKPGQWNASDLLSVAV
ncbi:MAG: UvrD-helicase domain-containing protein [Pseudomonadota bacterium]